MHSVWTHWSDSCKPLALSWKTLVNTSSPKLIAHLLHSHINVVPTPDILKMWGYFKHATCKLCTHKQCTLIHILSCCPVALRQGRYTWRHDSVLQTLRQPLLDHVQEQNRQIEKGRSEITFISSVEQRQREAHLQHDEKALQKLMADAAKLRRRKFKSHVKSVPRLRDHLLMPASDWQLLVDFTDKPIVFPPIICPSGQRPDIIIWSESTKTVIWAELTCPAEENIADANARKTSRYAELKTQAEGNLWTVHDFTIEAGARGCVARSFGFFLRKIGFGPTTANLLVKDVAWVCCRASFAIFRASRTNLWQNPSLLGGRGQNSQC
jgi:hypothetical protein